jgi:nucleoside-diphosphate-sugar epimerase
MKTVLVTGGTGFIGSHTAQALVESGWHLRLLVRDQKRASAWFDKRGIRVDAYVVGDISSAADMERAVEGCEAVVHAAAIVGLDAKDAAETERVNVDGTRNVVSAALAAGVKTIIYVSSASALYRHGAIFVDEASEIGTSTSGYGASKTRCEQYVRELQQQGAPIITTYPVGVIGPDDPKLSETVGALVSFLKDVVPLTTTGIQLVDVRDIARAHCSLLQRGAVVGDMLQNRVMLKGEYLPWPRFADMLQSLTGRKVRTMRLSPRVMMLMGRAVDFVRRFISIRAPVSVESMRYTCGWIEVKSRHGFVEYRDVGSSLGDTIRWLVRERHLPAGLAGRLVQ